MAEIDKGKILKEVLEYQRKGQHDEAIDELKKVLRVYPQDTRTLQKVAELQSKKGDKKEATKTYIQLAEIYEKDGFIDFAISVYKTILNIDDKLFNVHLKLGELFSKKNLKGEALSHFQTALKLCADKKTVEERIMVLEKMFEANPEDIFAIENLADHYYYDEGKADSAKNLMHKAAQIMKDASDFDKAQKLYERILNMDSKNELALRKVAELEINAGNPKRAADMYEKILESNPNDTETLKRATEVYRDIGDGEKTKLCFRRLADAYKLTDTDTALTEVYKEILNLDPNDSEAVEFLNRKNTESEIKFDKPPQKEWELEIGDNLKDVLEKEGVSFSNEFNSPSQEYSGESDIKPEPILGDKAQDVVQGVYSDLLSDGPGVSSQIESDKKSFSDTEMVDEKELEKIKVRTEEEPNVLDIQDEENHLKNENPRMGITVFEKQVTETLKKDANGAFYERGIAYKDMKMTKQAVAEFRKSITEEYKVPESYMMIGLCFLHRGDGRQALRWFQKGLTLNGLAVEHIVSLKSGSALALGTMGSLPDAIKVLEEILENYEKLGK
jgi:tetratricopeptide (TPR) repeat protein